MQTPPPSGSPSKAGQFRTPRRPATQPRLTDSSSKEQLPVVQLSRSFDNVWDKNEVRALVQFILLMSRPDKWPCHKRMAFWENAGKFVQSCARTLHMKVVIMSSVYVYVIL